MKAYCRLCSMPGVPAGRETLLLQLAEDLWTEFFLLLLALTGAG